MDRCSAVQQAFSWNSPGAASSTLQLVSSKCCSTPCLLILKRWGEFWLKLFTACWCCALKELSFYCCVPRVHIVRPPDIFLLVRVTDDGRIYAMTTIFCSVSPSILHFCCTSKWLHWLTGVWNFDSTFTFFLIAAILFHPARIWKKICMDSWMLPTLGEFDIINICLFWYLVDLSGAGPLWRKVSSFDAADSVCDIKAFGSWHQLPVHFPLRSQALAALVFEAVGS